MSSGFIYPAANHSALFLFEMLMLWKISEHTATFNITTCQKKQQQMTIIYYLHIDSKITPTFSPRAPPLELEPKPESPLGPLGPLSPFSPLSPRSPFSPLAPRAPIKRA